LVTSTLHRLQQPQGSVVSIIHRELVTSTLHRLQQPQGSIVSIIHRELVTSTLHRLQQPQGSVVSIIHRELVTSTLHRLQQPQGSVVSIIHRELVTSTLHRLQQPQGSVVSIIHRELVTSTLHRLQQPQFEDYWYIKATTFRGGDNYTEYVRTHNVMKDGSFSYQGITLQTSGPEQAQSKAYWNIKDGILRRKAEDLPGIEGTYKILLLEDKYFVDQCVNNTDHIYFHTISGWKGNWRNYLQSAADKLCLFYDDFITTDGDK
ncbi:hypothetical protein L9F63_009783, partial [Diploptera punctata]